MIDNILYIFVLSLGLFLRLFPIKAVQKAGRLTGVFFFTYSPIEKKLHYPI